MDIRSIKSCDVTIYIAGDFDVIKQVCREYCFEVGLCVNVHATDYIYTGGEQSGAVIGLINYPRFPSNPLEIKRKAEELAFLIQKKCCQQSFTIVTPEDSFYYEVQPKTS